MIGLDDADLALVRERAASAFDALGGRRVFLTGGTGFIGRWLVETFVDAQRHRAMGATLSVLTRDPERFRRAAPHLVCEDVVLVRGDVRGLAAVDADFVIHGAATSGALIDDAEALDVIDRGTADLLAAVAAHPPRRLLFISSGAVYGALPPGAGPVAEDARGAPNPLSPTSAYGEGKRIAELRCALAARGGRFSWSAARCFAFLGPHLPQDAHFAAGNFIGDARAGRPIVVNGDGTAVRSWLYAADLAWWLWQLLVFGENGQAYNVGSDVAVSVGELAYRVGSIGGVDVHIRGKDRGNERSVYVPLTDRAAALGLRQTVDLDDAIRRTLHWCSRCATPHHAPTDIRGPDR